jgi:spore maturation protein CgeB
MDPPDWARVHVWQADENDLRRVIAEAAKADVVVKASGVGVFDAELLAGLLGAARPGALTLFWDVDAPATLAEMKGAPDHPVRRALPALDLVLTYGGGTAIVAAYEGFGAARCEPIYNALDPETHYPVPPDARFACDLAFLGNRLPDREERVARFFLMPAARLNNRAFILAGNGWDDRAVPRNVRKIGHVYTRDHNALNATPRAVLNIARDSMAAVGFSPATRVFEAAGADACLITDAWDGIDLFLKPDEEVLVARDGLDVARHLEALTSARARAIGAAAGRRIRAEHTYARRARQVDDLLREAFAAKQERMPA